jgi:hypothetical protein
MQTAIYNHIKAASDKNIKQLAVLIDPDKIIPSRSCFLNPANQYKSC